MRRLQGCLLVAATTVAMAVVPAGAAQAAGIVGGGCTATPAPKTTIGQVFMQWQGCTAANGTTISAWANSTVTYPKTGTTSCDVVLNIYQDGNFIGPRNLACNVNNKSNAVSVGLAAAHLYTFQWYVYVYSGGAYYSARSTSPALSYIGGSLTALAAVSVAELQVWNGVRYVLGGASPSAGFDCSGLTLYAYQQAHLTPTMPHSSEKQYTEFPPLIEGKGTVDTSKLLPGDLMFFKGDGTFTPPGHEGIYLGNGYMAEAASTAIGLRVSLAVNAGTYYGAARPAP